MSNFGVLLIATISIAFFHTILGPDHYVPFIVLARSGKWSYRKTFIITTLCGIGHVASSIILGLVGVGFGVAMSKINYFETYRGHIAGWLLIAFGLIYGIWGLRQAYKNRPHTHLHMHPDGKIHTHKHTHSDEHSHAHPQKDGSKTTFWVLFLIFVFGPCEPLIPLVMVPAFKGNYHEVVVVSIVFSIITIVTMLAMVFASYLGLRSIRSKTFEKYIPALSGLIILLAGIGIEFLGL